MIRYRGTSPKLGTSQGWCPYPNTQVSFFGDGGGEGARSSSFLTEPKRISFKSCISSSRKLQRDGIILHFPHNILGSLATMNFSFLHHFHLDGKYPNWRVCAYEKYSQFHILCSPNSADEGLLCNRVEGFFEIDPSNALKPVWILVVFSVLDEAGVSGDAGQSFPFRLRCLSFHGVP